MQVCHICIYAGRLLYIYMCVFPGRAPRVQDFQRRRRLTGVKTSITVCVAVCVLQCVCSRCLTGVRTSIKCRGGRDKAPRSILNLKFYFTIHTHTHTQCHTHAITHARARAHFLPPTHTSLTHARTRTLMHAHIQTHACECVYVCIYKYVRTISPRACASFTHTGTQTQTQTQTQTMT